MTMAEDELFSTTTSTAISEDTGVQLTPLPTLIPTVLLIPLVVVVAVVGNILVIASYCIDYRLRTVSNLYLLHLAICDLLLALVSMPVYMLFTCLRQSWIFGKAFCKIFLVNDYTLCAMSAFLVTLISLDQLLILRQGVRYFTQETKTKAYVKITVAWLLSFLIYSPAIVGWDYWVGHSHLDSYECDVEFADNEVYTFFTMVLEFFIPSIALMVLNSAVYWEIRKRTKVSIAGTTPSTVSKGNKSAAIDRKDCQEANTHTAGNAINTTDSSMDPNAVVPVSIISSLSRHFHDSDVNKANGNNKEEPALSLHSALYPGPPAPHCTPEAVIEGMDNNRVAAILKDRDNSLVPAIIVDNKAINANVLNEPAGRNHPEKFSKMTVTFSGSQVIRHQSSSQTTLSDDPTSCFTGKSEYQKKVLVTTSNCNKAARKDLKAARALFIFVFAFLVTWAPYTIATTVSAFCDSCVNSDVHEFFVWWLWIKSAINPFLYASNNPRFKMNFFKILGKVCFCCPAKWRTMASSAKEYSVA